MKKTILSIVVFLSLLFLASCEKNKKVKQFATDFAAAVQSGNKSEIIKMYPGAVDADSLVFAFDAEKSQIETQKNGNIKIVLSEGKDVTLVENENGEGFKVKESHGVFAYPADHLDFAKKTGQWKEGLNDVLQNKRMAEKEFKKTLVSSFSKDFVKMLVIKEKTIVDDTYLTPATEGCSVFSVYNNSKKSILGGDYELRIKTISFDFSGIEEKVLTEAGKDIKPNGSVVFRVRFDGHLAIDSADIFIKLSDEDLFNKYYTPTGKEFEEYIAANGKDRIVDTNVNL